MTAAPPPARVLVVEDDPEIRRFLEASLQTEGYEVRSADGGRAALAQFAERAPDLIVLDLGLPDIEGVDVVRKVRSSGATPILILSARSDERQKIEALDAGADDYLTKPFGIGELRARIRVALRHLRRDAEASDRPYELDGLRIDVARHRVQRDGRDLHLTPREFGLLSRLANSVGRVVTHRQLLADVWGAEYVEHTHYLRIYMAQLRAKIESNPADPRFLLTETGVGYRLAGE